MYLASATRPDISFAMSKLSQFVSNLGENHWPALERVLRCLKGTMSYDIHYTGYPKVLEVSVMRIGYLILMSFMPQADMYCCLEVALFPRSLASRPF
jgi:hypothetical protein